MANMFRCVLASGGGALILTVTCDSVFAGQTITCTDGTTTLTQICPSTSPYTVEFRIPNSGTWTISSGTDSTSVVIPDAIELHYLPNGSTVTPTDDIQIWLHCANIWDKTYTTISQVLADSTTVTALIASNNAADYMARSTSWASSVTANSSAMTKIGADNYCANKLLSNSTWLNVICNSTYFESVLNVKVPTMTSNTAPSGKVTLVTGSIHNGTQPYKAFDGNIPTGWDDDAYAATFGKGSGTISYMFPQAVNVRKIVPHSIGTVSAGVYAFPNYKIHGSNDNSTWTELVSRTGLPNSWTSQTDIITSSTKFKYYKFSFSASTREWYMLSELQLYGRA